MKKVAIITRTKDRPIVLPRVRASIEGQVFDDFIWVIVNDAGCKEAVEECARQARNNSIDVQVIHRQHSKGIEAASNDGINHTESEYIVIHDDDDSWHPDFLLKSVFFLDKQSEYAGVITHTLKVYETLQDGEIIKQNSEPYNDWLRSIHIADMVQGNLFAPIAFLFRRSVCLELNGFDESLPVLGDWDFALRVLMEGDIGVLPEVLAYYHIRNQVNVSNKVYGNTISLEMDKHAKYETLYINKKIREDIRAGHYGLGMLLANARQLKHIANQPSFFLVCLKQLLRKYTFLRRLKKWLFND